MSAQTGLSAHPGLDEQALVIGPGVPTPAYSGPVDLVESMDKPKGSAGEDERNSSVTC